MGHKMFSNDNGARRQMKEQNDKTDCVECVKQYALGEVVLKMWLMFCDQCLPVQVIAYNTVSQIMLFSINRLTMIDRKKLA